MVYSLSEDGYLTFEEPDIEVLKEMEVSIKITSEDFYTHSWFMFKQSENIMLFNRKWGVFEHLKAPLNVEDYVLMGWVKYEYPEIWAELKENCPQDLLNIFEKGM